MFKKSFIVFLMFFLFAERGSVLLGTHRNQQSDERTKLEKHRRKCESNPESYLGVIMDGMDQSKTDIPHLTAKPKDADGDLSLRMHLVGCLVYSAKMTFRVFLNYPNVRNDANLSITILQTILSEFGGPLPPVLYLQLDNTARENKNNLLMAYLHLLVHARVFKKIRIGFLLVGHTHDRIDQMFSLLSRKLNRNDAPSQPRLEEVIISAQTIVPKISTITDIFDFRKFAFSEPSITINKLQNLSFSHQFKIERKNVDDLAPLLWAKKVSTDAEWLPTEGVQYLKDDIPCRSMFFVKGLPLRRSGVGDKELRNPSPEQMEIWLKEFENRLTVLSRYITDPADRQWWSSFFATQREINSKFLQPQVEASSFVLQVNDSTGASNQPAEPRPSRGSNVDEINVELLGPNRPVYCGPYRNPRTIEKEKGNRDGDLKDLEVDTWICVQASMEPDGRPFWLAKVLSIDTRSPDGSPLQVSILWYTCSSDEDDPYEAKYRIELRPLPRPSRSYARHKPTREENRDSINISETTVLAYNFILKTSNQMLKKTVDTIKFKLRQLECPSD